MTRHEIQILRPVGMAQTAIAAKTGVSVRSVRRIEDEPAMSSSDTVALIRARGVGRPSLAAPWAGCDQTCSVERRSGVGQHWST